MFERNQIVKISGYYYYRIIKENDSVATLETICDTFFDRKYDMVIDSYIHLLSPCNKHEVHKVKLFINNNNV